MGAFDLRAWQFWWMVGLGFGAHWAKGDLRLDRWAHRMALPAAILAVFFLVLRYSEAAGFVQVGRFGVLLNKWDFGLGRIVDFAALATLAVRFQSVLKRIAVRPLVLSGQASLEVFCVHLFCVFVALIAVGGNPALTGWRAASAILISLLAMLLTAVVMVKRRTMKDDRQTVGLVPRPAVRRVA